MHQGKSAYMWDLVARCIYGGHGCIRMCACVWWCMHVDTGGSVTMTIMGMHVCGREFGNGERTLGYIG